MSGRLRALLSGRGTLHAAMRAVGASSLVLLLNVVTGILTARLLGREGRGIFVAVTLWQQFLALVAVSGLQSAVVVLMRQRPERAGAIAAAAAATALGSAAALGLVGLALVPAVMTQYPPWAVAATQVCLLLVPVNALHMIFKQGLVGIGDFPAFNALSVLSPALVVVALVALDLALGMTALIAIVALGVAAVAGLVVTAEAWRRRLRPERPRDGPLWRRLWALSLRAAGADLVVALAGNADRLILIPLVAEADLGLYAVAFSFSRLLLVVLPAIESVVFASMAGRDPAGMKVLHDRAFRLAATSLAAMLAVLWLAGPWPLRLFYGAEFAAATALFRILSVEAALSLLNTITMRYMIASGRPALASAVQGAGLAVSAGLILALAPAYGVAGAAWGMAGATAVKLALGLGLLRARGEPLPGLLAGAADLRLLRARL